MSPIYLANFEHSKLRGKKGGERKEKKEKSSPKPFIGGNAEFAANFFLRSQATEKKTLQQLQNRVYEWVRKSLCLKTYFSLHT